MSPDHKDSSRILTVLHSAFPGRASGRSEPVCIEEVPPAAGLQGKQLETSVIIQVRDDAGLAEQWKWPEN